MMLQLAPLLLLESLGGRTTTLSRVSFPFSSALLGRRSCKLSTTATNKKDNIARARHARAYSCSSKGVEALPGLTDRGVKRGFIDAVGNTPLIRLNGVSEATGCDIYGKAEYCNPGGSVRDRAAVRNASEIVRRVRVALFVNLLC